MVLAKRVNQSTSMSGLRGLHIAYGHALLHFKSSSSDGHLPDDSSALRGKLDERLARTTKAHVQGTIEVFIDPLVDSISMAYHDS